MPELLVLRELKIRVELPTFLIFFAFLVSDSVKSNWVIFKTCYVVLGYNKSECALLGSKNSDNETTSLEKIVEPYSAVISMVCSLVENFSSAIFCLFVGPWSDRFGRKPILVLPVIGYLLYYSFLTVFSSIDDSSPWLLLICLVPVILTGGFPSYLTGLLCYITDLSSEKDRGMRMAIFDAFVYLGIFLGNISSSFVFEATNYPTLFFIPAMCCFLNLIFTIFYIPESQTNRESEGHFKAIFQTSNINEMVKITFKERSNFARYTVICCLTMSLFGILVMNGTDSVTFLFLREKYHWSLQKYTLFLAASSLIYVLGTVLGVYFLHKVLKIPETILILVALISSLNGALVMALAETDESIYAVVFFKLLGGVFNPMVRSLVSKVVPNEEVGAIFSLITASQFLVGMAGSPLYTFVYTRTIAENPAIFNFVSVGIYIFLIFISVAVIIVRTLLSSSHNNYGHLINKDGMDVTTSP